MAKFSTGNIDYVFDDLPIHVLNVDGTKTLRIVSGVALIEYSAATYEADNGMAWDMDYSILSLSDLTLTDHEYETVDDPADHYCDLIITELEKRSGRDIEDQIVETVED